MIAYRMRVNNRKKYLDLHLVPFDDPTFDEGRLGKHIDFLIPCLDPDATEE
jgi:hypothetical protein